MRLELDMVGKSYISHSHLKRGLINYCLRSNSPSPYWLPLVTCYKAIQVSV